MAPYVQPSELIFSKVTDLFCRRPLPTLLHGPEAARLGDLMRLWVLAWGASKPLLQPFKDNGKHSLSLSLSLPLSRPLSPSRSPSLFLALSLSLPRVARVAAGTSTKSNIEVPLPCLPLAGFIGQLLCMVHMCGVRFVVLKLFPGCGFMEVGVVARAPSVNIERPAPAR